MPPDLSPARERIESLAVVQLGHFPSPVDELPRLREAIGTQARLYVKRDDAIPFGSGGNKVRKLTLVAAEAISKGADILITCGGVQSNHCRATAATAARLGLACHIVANGRRPERLTGNALLVSLYGAEVTYVESRTERAPMMEQIAADLRTRGQNPYIIPLGASTALGAMALALGVREMEAQGMLPDVIVHASSSGGTQAGLIAGCALYAPHTRVIGVSADDPARAISEVVANLLRGMERHLGLPEGTLGGDACDVDDAFVGDGYGIASDTSREAQSLAASTEAIVTDHWYTAKAMASLIARARAGEFRAGESVLFWHTGGQVAATIA